MEKFSLKVTTLLSWTCLLIFNDLRFNIQWPDLHWPPKVLRVQHTTCNTHTHCYIFFHKNILMKRSKFRIREHNLLNSLFIYIYKTLFSTMEKIKYFPKLLAFFSKIYHFFRLEKNNRFILLLGKIKNRMRNKKIQIIYKWYI